MPTFHTFLNQFVKAILMSVVYSSSRIISRIFCFFPYSYFYSVFFKNLRRCCRLTSLLIAFNTSPLPGFFFSVNPYSPPCQIEALNLSLFYQHYLPHFVPPFVAFLYLPHIINMQCLVYHPFTEISLYTCISCIQNQLYFIFLGPFVDFLFL